LWISRSIAYKMESTWNYQTLSTSLDVRRAKRKKAKAWNGGYARLRPFDPLSPSFGLWHQYEVCRFRCGNRAWLASGSLIITRVRSLRCRRGSASLPGDLSLDPRALPDEHRDGDEQHRADPQRMGRKTTYAGSIGGLSTTRPAARAGHEEGRRLASLSGSSTTLTFPTGSSDPATSTASRPGSSWSNSNTLCSTS
jgi:hypothetical protein